MPKTFKGNTWDESSIADWGINAGFRVTNEIGNDNNRS
jgi:hypothetical protein